MGRVTPLEIHVKWSCDLQVVEKVDLHYENKRLYHIKNDPMKIIVHYDDSIDRYSSVTIIIACYTDSYNCQVIPKFLGLLL